jgi:hypothetical protein
MPTAHWKKDDRIDWLLFRAQLEGPVFFDRVMDFEHTDPQTYVKWILLDDRSSLDLALK